MIPGFTEVLTGLLDSAGEPEVCFECNKCKTRVPRGIISISHHWSECEGKEYYEALMAMGKEVLATGRKITITDLDSLGEKYLKKHP